jgi:hypothetical protein
MAVMNYVNLKAMQATLSNPSVGDWIFRIDDAHRERQCTSGHYGPGSVYLRWHDNPKI